MGTQLGKATEQLELQKILLSGLAQIFIDASQQAKETQVWEEEHRRQKELDDMRRLVDAETKRVAIEKQ